MTTSDTYPRCIFCGCRADSREHAIPAWISKRLGIREFLSAEGAIAHGVTRRKQPISFASLRARIFCTPCNTHFKHLEDAVIPLVVPMAKSQVFSLGAEHRELLALWATKTAAAPLATTAPELRDAMPLDHRDSIRHEGRPPRDAWVGWFPWNGRPVVAGGLGEVDGYAGAGATYVAVLAFAKVGFVVNGFRAPLPTANLDLDKPSLVRFWPGRPGFVDWPPLGPPLEPGADLATLLNTAPVRRAAA